MKLFATTCVWLLLTVSAHADTLLLDMLTFGGSSTSPELGGWSEFQTENTDFLITYTQTELNQVFSMPSDDVQKINQFNDLKIHRNWKFRVFSPPFGVEGERFGFPDKLWTLGNPHVPILGYGFEGYNLTRVEITPTHLSWVEIPSPHHSSFWQAHSSAVIRFYGELAVMEVPEPSTWYLVLIGFGMYGLYLVYCHLELRRK